MAIEKSSDREAFRANLVAKLFLFCWPDDVIRGCGRQNRNIYQTFNDTKRSPWTDNICPKVFCARDVDSHEVLGARTDNPTDDLAQGLLQQVGNHSSRVEEENQFFVICKQFKASASHQEPSHSYDNHHDRV